MDLPEFADLEFAPRMSDADALLWNIEKDPLLRSTITSIYLLDRAPDRERLMRRIDRTTRRVVRLRQRVRSLPLSLGTPLWEIDPNFDLRYHVRWIRAAGDGAPAELFDLAEPIAMQGFDRARPLWEFTVVEDLADGRAAIITKIHHSITDGIGGVLLQGELLDLERHPADPPEDGPLPAAPEAQAQSDTRRLLGAMAFETARGSRGARGAVDSLLSSLGHLREDPVGLAMGTLHNLASVARVLAPAAEPLSPLMTERSLSVRFANLNLPLEPLKAAARLVGGRLNDAFVAGVAGGLARYHRHHGYDDVGTLRMGMPVSIRNGDTTSLAGNRFVPLRIPIPLDLDDPLDRMNTVRATIERARSEPALALTDPIANLINRLPATATTALFGALVKGVDIVTSNVPGPPVPVFLGGARLDAQIAFGPMAGSGINIVLLSYADEVNLGITLDPAAVPDAGVFIDCLTDSYEEILKLL